MDIVVEEEDNNSLNWLVPIAEAPCIRFRLVNLPFVLEYSCASDLYSSMYMSSFGD